MTDVITRPTAKPGSKQTSKQTSKGTSKPTTNLVVALACAHDVHELCRLTSCECGCHGSHD